MADDINKKINIDIDIKNDGQQQIQQYKIAFDNLRTAIDILSDPLKNVSKNINSLDKSVTSLSSSINKMNSNSSTVSTWANKIGNAIGNIGSSFAGVQKIIETFGISFGEFTAEITGGVSLLISFLPVIVDWVSDLFKADTTTKSLNQTLREHKTALDAVRQAHEQGAQDAQDELTRVKLLYRASQDHNLSLSERKKAVADLQSQYPTYFGNLSQEAILTGKAAGQYKDLAKYILAAAQARAAEDMMTDNSKRQLTDKAKTDDLQKQIKEKQQQLDAINMQIQDAVSGGAYGDGRKGYAIDLLKQKTVPLITELNALQGQYSHIDTDSKILDQRNKALSDDVAANVEKNGLKVLTGLQTTAEKGNKIVESSSGAQIKSVKKQTKAYDELGKKIDEVNARQKSDPQPDDEDQAALSAPVISDAQKTSDALKQIESDRLVQQMKDDDAARAQKLAKEKQAAQQLKDFELQTAGQVSSAAFSILQNSIKQQTDAKLAALENQKNSELSNSNLTSAQKIAIEAQFKKKEDAVKLKAFKQEQEAALAQAVINGALAITKVTSQTGVLSPLVIPEIIAETAIEIAKITAEKPPAYASGGLHYSSDGRGGVLPGYSRTDNTNAYLRSGEGIVVSEAMRAPWARNLVSAINVGFGGRDFSITNPGRGYAVGGIFTDGGNANRYYNAPVNDQKNLANTIAYQMINNFPPVYVDVKDINNQQNILAQTINRVNL